MEHVSFVEVPPLETFEASVAGIIIYMRHVRQHHNRHIYVGYYCIHHVKYEILTIILIIIHIHIYPHNQHTYADFFGGSQSVPASVDVVRRQTPPRKQEKRTLMLKQNLGESRW